MVKPFHLWCCQQYWEPGCAFREHCVPFFVMAWQRPGEDVVDDAALRPEVVGAGVATKPDATTAVFPQTEQRP